MEYLLLGFAIYFYLNYRERKKERRRAKIKDGDLDAQLFCQWFNVVIDIAVHFHLKQHVTLVVQQLVDVFVHFSVHEPLYDEHDHSPSDADDDFVWQSEHLTDSLQQQLSVPVPFRDAQPICQFLHTFGKTMKQKKN